MFLLSLFSTLSALAEECHPLPNGIVISKYYLTNCHACKRMDPVMSEIEDSVKRAGLDLIFRKVECSACECEGITSFPTVVLTEDKNSVATTVGFKEYNTMTKWIEDKLNLPADVFKAHVEHEEGKIKTLSNNDFLGGFNGQWLILFYDNKHDEARNIFKTLANTYTNKITFGEISKSEAETVSARFNITEYPYILGVNHGNNVPYTNKIDLSSLTSFCEILYKPSFEHITYSELKNKSKDSKNGEPTYIVLYKDYELASHYFNDMAQHFKFKAKIFRSDDPLMFSAAGKYPVSVDEHDTDKDVGLDKKLQFAVYKNSSFYFYPSSIDKSNDMVDWIFHTHFPHVTNIRNDNFYTVFHGIKPVVIFLNNSEDLIDQFERLAGNWNLGTSSSSLVFATLDTNEYPVFKNQVLKDVQEPAILLYNPIKSTWYYKKVKLNRENFIKEAMKLIDGYYNNKLPIYPKPRSSRNLYFLGSLALGLSYFAYKLFIGRLKVD